MTAAATPLFHRAAATPASPLPGSAGFRDRAHPHRRRLVRVPRVHAPSLARTVPTRDRRPFHQASGLPRRCTRRSWRPHPAATGSDEAAVEFGGSGLRPRRRAGAERRRAVQAAWLGPLTTTTPARPDLGPRQPLSRERWELQPPRALLLHRSTLSTASNDPRDLQLDINDPDTRFNQLATHGTRCLLRGGVSGDTRRYSVNSGQKRHEGRVPSPAIRRPPTTSRSGGWTNRLRGRKIMPQHRFVFAPVAKRVRSPCRPCSRTRGRATAGARLTWSPDSTRRLRPSSSLVGLRDPSRASCHVAELFGFDVHRFLACFGLVDGFDVEPILTPRPTRTRRLDTWFQGSRSRPGRSRCGRRIRARFSHGSSVTRSTPRRGSPAGIRQGQLTVHRELFPPGVPRCPVGDGGYRSTSRKSAARRWRHGWDHRYRCRRADRHLDGRLLGISATRIVPTSVRNRPRTSRSSCAGR